MDHARVAFERDVWFLAVCQDCVRGLGSVLEVSFGEAAGRDAWVEAHVSRLGHRVSTGVRERWTVADDSGGEGAGGD